MRIFIFIISILLPGILAAQTFTLTGKLSGMNLRVEKVYLHSMEDKDLEYKVAVNNNTYVISGKLDGPAQFNIVPMYGAEVDRSKLEPAASFIYLQPGHITVTHTGKFENITVKGSEIQTTHEHLDQLISGKGEDSIAIIYGDFFKAHPASPYAVYALKTYAANQQPHNWNHIYNEEALPFGITSVFLAYSGRTDFTKACEGFALLPEKLKQSTAGRNMAKDIEWAKLDEEGNFYRDKIDSLAGLYLLADKQAKDSLELKMRSVMDTLKGKVYVDYLKGNPFSPIALDVLKLYAGDNISVPDKAMQLFDQLSDKVRQSPKGIAYKARLSKALINMAVDFAQPDTSGKIIQLKALRGKYVLVDFWASWCKPCRAENPNLIRAYDLFKDKGFQIISISLDTDRGKWVEAIRKDKLNWIHVSDLKQPNEVAKRYDILGIPANLLIDPTGKIIGKNLAGAALLEQLNQVIH